MNGPYKIENVSIEKIYRSEKDRNDKPYVSSKGNPFVKVDIYIDPRTIEHTKFEGKMTYFDYYNNTANWDIGTPISGEIVVNEVNDRTYFNFNLPPSGKKALELDIKEHEDRIKKLEDAVFGKSEEQAAIEFSKEALKEDDQAEEESNFEEELPF